MIFFMPEQPIKQQKILYRKTINISPRNLFHKYISRNINIIIVLFNIYLEIFLNALQTNVTYTTNYILVNYSLLKGFIAFS